MGQTDDALCPFPGGLAFCIKFTVLCHQPVQVGAGGSDHGSLQQGGTDAGFQLAALFILDRGGTADEALTALREISTQHKILLPAGAGDVAGSRGLRGHLSVKVNVHRTIDGNKVINLGDAGHIVGIIHRDTAALRKMCIRDRTCIV